MTPNEPEQQPELENIVTPVQTSTDGPKLFIELLNATEGQDGNLIVQRKTLRAGWIDISHVSVLRRRKEIIKHPERFRIVTRTKEADRVSKGTLWGPSDINPFLLLRRLEWPQERWVMPMGVNEDGVSVMIGSVPWNVTFEDLAANWVYRFGHMREWSPCRSRIQGGSESPMNKILP